MARYLLQASRFDSRVLAICSGVGAGLGGRGGLSFFLAARCSRFRCNSVSLFLRYHSCFNCLAFSGFLLGISNTTDVCLGCLSISIVLSANHRARSRDGAGGGNLVPMGGTTPDLPPVDQIPHLSPFHQSPDNHVISCVFLVYKSPSPDHHLSPFHHSPDAHVTSCGFQSIKVRVWHGKNSNCLLCHAGRPLVSL